MSHTVPVLQAINVIADVPSGQLVEKQGPASYIIVFTLFNTICISQNCPKAFLSKWNALNKCEGVISES